MSVDQCRLIFAVFEVASRHGDDLLFSPSDVFQFHCGKGSSGSSLRQLETALATFCDLTIAYRNHPSLGDGKSALVSKIDTGRLSLSSRSIRKGESVITKLDRAFKDEPLRRRQWRIRLSDAGQCLIERAHYFRVDSDAIGTLPRSPVARWLYLWVHSHGVTDGKILPYRLSTIAAHAGFTMPSYDDRYSGTEDKVTSVQRLTRQFHRVQERIQRYIPVAFNRISDLCGWGLSHSRNNEPVIHVLRVPSALQEPWNRIVDRFNPMTATALLLRKGERLRDGLEKPSVEQSSSQDALLRWTRLVGSLAKTITGDSRARPSALLQSYSFRIAGSP